jgi:hypothetical protein
MDSSDLLLVGIEVSVAFAGFAGVIATFQFRDTVRIKRGDIVGLTMIVDFGLVAALYSALPLVLSIFHVEGGILWVVCSSLAAIAVCRAMYIVHTKMKPAAISSHTRILFGILQGVAALVVLSLILNAANLVFHREPGPFIAAILYGLSLVGYMFLRLLIRPLWIAVHEHEAGNVGGA